MNPTAAPNFADDIPLDIARAAHRGTSHDPDKRGDQERAEYVATLQGDLDNLTALADTEEKRARLAVEFERYRAGYAKHARALLVAKSACISTLIAGPSGFPVKRAQKANARADKAYTALAEYRKRALAAIRRELCPEEAPIMASDADAVERLQKKLADLEAEHARMVAANTAIRANAKKGPDAQIAALVEMGFGAAFARDLLKPDELGRVGFADFQLTNSRASIRATKDRIASVQRMKAAAPTVEVRAFARLEVVPDENRVRLYFPGKPDVGTRAKLTKAGFRWAPSLPGKPHQQYINTMSLLRARAIAGDLVEPAAGEEPAADAADAAAEEFLAAPIVCRPPNADEVAELAREFPDFVRPLPPPAEAAPAAEDPVMAAVRATAEARIADRLKRGEPTCGRDLGEMGLCGAGPEELVHDARNLHGHAFAPIAPIGADLDGRAPIEFAAETAHRDSGRELAPDERPAPSRPVRGFEQGAFRFENLTIPDRSEMEQQPMFDANGTNPARTKKGGGKGNGKNRGRGNQHATAGEDHNE